jgi:hypothetical protein
VTEAIALLATAILLFAAFLVTHVALLWIVARSDAAPRWKWLALVPVMTPVSAWIAKKRGAAITWGVLLLAYAIVRLVGG